MDLTLILLTLAAVLLLGAALGVKLPVHLGWAGLALVVVVFIAERAGA